MEDLDLELIVGDLDLELVVEDFESYTLTLSSSFSSSCAEWISIWIAGCAGIGGDSNDIRSALNFVDGEVDSSRYPASFSSRSLVLHTKRANVERSFAFIVQQDSITSYLSGKF